MVRLVLIFWLLGAPQTLAQTGCRHALVLALDVSGSVNPTEYQQQIDGLAAALQSGPVRDVILSNPDFPIAVSVFEWSSQNHQGMIQDWIDIVDSNALDHLIARIRNHQRQRAGLKTAIGRAVAHAANLLEQRPDCTRQTIDVSGDGENNIGPLPTAVYAQPKFLNIVVNALVIGEPSPEGTVPGSQIYTKSELALYYQTDVIHGPGAFTMIAEGYADYARAMSLKLVRELEAPVLGSLNPTIGK